jgi:hypothetical protein
MTLSDEISSVVSELHLEHRIRQLPSADAQNAILVTEETFVTRKNARWWWEHLSPEFSCASSSEVSDGYRLLPIICPDADVWLFASDDEDPPWPVFSGRPSEFSAVIAECRHFEYALASPSLDWIVFETHHNILVAAGEPVASRLQQHAG